ncbi:hypothetical protein RLIN73S_02776 [Rhodanobacter lindaniclasticus]
MLTARSMFCTDSVASLNGAGGVPGFSRSPRSFVSRLNRLLPVLVSNVPRFSLALLIWFGWKAIHWRTSGMWMPS